MPIPKPKPRESQEDYMGRCMHAIADEFDGQQQRVAVCMSTYRDAQKPKNFDATMETKDVAFEVKDVNEIGQFEGYASTFNNVDLGGDKVAPGAFQASLNEHKRKGTSPLMLWSHNPEAPIGIWNDLAEDGKGLRVKGTLLVDQKIPEADKVHALLKAGAVRGLSIGYRVKDADFENDVRILKELDVPEVSVVSFPMNQRAKVTAVKSEEFDEALALAQRLKTFARKLRDGEPMQIKEFEDILREAGIPKRMATDIASVGYAKAIRSESGGKGATSAVVLRLAAAAKAFKPT